MDSEYYAPLDLNEETQAPQETVADIEARLNKTFEEKISAYEQKTAPAVDFYQKIQQGFQPSQENQLDPVQQLSQQVKDLRTQLMDKEAAQHGFSNYAQAISLYEAMSVDRDPNVRNKAEAADAAWRNGNIEEAAKIISSHFGSKQADAPPLGANLSQGYSPGANSGQTQSFPKMDGLQITGYQMSTNPEHKNYLNNYVNYWSQKDQQHIRDLMSSF
jgi:hypothetical protein